MGDLLSTPNSTSADETPAMSPSISTESNQRESTQKLQSAESRTPIHETSDPPTDTKTAGNQENPEQSMKDGGDGGAEEEEEEEAGECGFCLFMKGGGCKETFTEWESCIEAAEKNEEDVVDKCFQATAALKKCMEAHSDYYAPILQAEKSLEEDAAKQSEEEKDDADAVKQTGEEKDDAVKQLEVGEGGGSHESEEKEKEEALGGNDSKKQS